MSRTPEQQDAAWDALATKCASVKTPVPFNQFVKTIGLVLKTARSNRKKVDALTKRVDAMEHALKFAKADIDAKLQRHQDRIDRHSGHLSRIETRLQKLIAKVGD